MGTVLTAGACVALLSVTWAASVMVGWIAQVSATQDAADLAALAAASSWAQGEDACEAARGAAERNASDLMTCSMEGDERSFVVEVQVSQRLEPAMPGALGTVVRVASAGSAQ